MKLGRKTMTEYMRRFGFFTDPPTDYPGDQMVPSGGPRRPPHEPDARQPARRRRPHGDRPGRAARSRRCRWRRWPRRSPTAACAWSRGWWRARDRPRRAHRRRHRARRRPQRVMSEKTVGQADGDDEAGGQGGHRHGGRAAGRRGRGQDRHRRGRHRAAASTSLWFIGFTEPTWPSRSRSSASQGGTGGVVAAPIAKQVLEALGRGADAGRRARHDDRRPLPRRSTASARAAWPTSTAPRTRSSAGASALKLLHRALRRGPGVRRALPPRGLARRPASSTRTWSQVFDRGEWDGTYYIAMEFLEGRTLKEIIRERGRRSTPTRAIDIVVQILRAARFAHKRGIVHRDIKPHNVIVDDEGNVKVTDFGIARAGASDMTETGSIIGTAQYLSPEQAQGHPVDGALGPLLDRHRALRAARPAGCRSTASRRCRSRSSRSPSEPIPPAELNPAVPPALEAVVMRALEKDPARRFAERRRVHRRAGGGARRGRPPARSPTCRRAPAPSEPRRSRRPTERSRRWLAVGAARAGARRRVGVGAYLLLQPEQGDRARRRRPAVGERRGRRSTTRGFEVHIEHGAERQGRPRTA